MERLTMTNTFQMPVGQSALFLDQEYAKKMYPDWTIVSKNF
jgi:hypothetical protein